MNLCQGHVFVQFDLFLWGEIICFEWLRYEGILHFDLVVPLSWFRESCCFFLREYVQEFMKFLWNLVLYRKGLLLEIYLRLYSSGSGWFGINPGTVFHVACYGGNYHWEFGFIRRVLNVVRTFLFLDEFLLDILGKSIVFDCFWVVWLLFQCRVFPFSPFQGSLGSFLLAMWILGWSADFLILSLGVNASFFVCVCQVPVWCIGWLSPFCLAFCPRYRLELVFQDFFFQHGCFMHSLGQWTFCWPHCLGVLQRFLSVFQCCSKFLWAST